MKLSAAGCEYVADGKQDLLEKDVTRSLEGGGLWGGKEPTIREDVMDVICVMDVMGIMEFIDVRKYH